MHSDYNLGVISADGKLAASSLRELGELELAFIVRATSLVMVGHR
jgi:hypothetical protein